MKTSLLFTGMAAMAFLLTGCNKETDTSDTGGKTAEIILSTPSTRTSNDGLSTNWESGDALNVFYAAAGSTDYSDNTEFDITDVENNKATGTVSLTEEAYDWYLLYPYSSYITTPANTSSGYIPVGSKSSGSQTQDGLNSTAHLAGSYLPVWGVAKNVDASETPVVEMKHATSVVKVYLTNALSEAITVTNVSFTGSEDIVGTYYIDISGDEPVFTSSGSNYVSTTASLTVSDADALAAGESAAFYIAVKPFTASAGDTLAVKVTADAGICEKTVVLSEAAEFAAGTVKTLNVSFSSTSTKGTESDPYTASEALAAAEELSSSGSITGVYVSGVVSEISEISTSYGNATYYISDDGTTSSDQFLIYRGLYLDGESFTSEDQLQVGDKVVIYGTIVNYKGTTPEMSAKNYLVSLERDSSSSSTTTLSWSAASDYYYIVGLSYCSDPADSDYETMGIYVPTAYLTEGSDGTYTINTSGTCNGYTASTAPVVIPVNTSGYSAQSAPTGESSKVTDYIDAGFIYLWPGCRGRNHGAPTGCTDLKAAIRYYRSLVQEGAAPGDTTCMFTFGHSGGGAQSSIMGTSGNSSRFDDYLELIGADMDHTDDILGSMCWCPITNLDYADQAYEWNMGLTRSSLSSADASISKELAGQFATYINAIGFKDPDNSSSTLSLESTDNGYYQSGSYYEYIIGVINDAVSRYNSYNGASVSSYSASSSTALYNFASSYKSATKGLGAFDDYDGKSTAENTLMGISGTAGHFDANLATLVSSYASSYSSYFTSDLSDSNVDDAGHTVEYRLLTYTPLFYLIDNDTYYSGGGPGSSDVAKYWRIRSGITQGDTALCTEANLALALSGYDGVSSVDFETIWNQGHTEAEDTGDATDNFIEWVQECVSDFRGN